MRIFVKAKSQQENVSAVGVVQIAAPHAFDDFLQKIHGWQRVKVIFEKQKKGLKKGLSKGCST